MGPALDGTGLDAVRAVGIAQQRGEGVHQAMRQQARMGVGVVDIA